MAYLKDLMNPVCHLAYGIFCSSTIKIILSAALLLASPVEFTLRQRGVNHFLDLNAIQQYAKFTKGIEAPL